MATSDLRDQLQTALGTQYTVEREIGRGGMATVYLAEDAKHHRSVALKVLHADLAVDMLEPLVKVPGRYSAAYLRIDPNFARLRGNPRFERLIAHSG